MTATRTETDSFGAIEVPADHHWGAQTERSLNYFRIGDEKMPRPLIRALALVKQAAAITNRDLGELETEHADAIAEAAAAIAAGNYANEFPLSVWQTGSGTQTNMNMNEVIASLCNEKLTGRRGGKSPADEVLDKAERQIDTVARSLKEGRRRTKAVERKLREVETLDEAASIQMLGAVVDPGDDEEDTADPAEF